MGGVDDDEIPLPLLSSESFSTAMCPVPERVPLTFL